MLPPAQSELILIPLQVKVQVKVKMNNVQRIGALILGIGIAVASAVAWRFWQIDDVFAILGVLSGLGIAAEACGIRNAI